MKYLFPSFGTSGTKQNELSVFGLSIHPERNNMGGIRSSSNNVGELSHLQWLMEKEKTLTDADKFLIKARIEQLENRIRGGKSMRRKRRKSVRRKSVRRQKRLV